MTATLYKFPVSKIVRLVPAYQEQRWLDHARKCALALARTEQERWDAAVSIISGAYKDEDLTPCA